MILGIGIDLCRIERVRRSVTRFGKAWLDEVFAEAEQLQLERDDDLPVAAAIGFALKEAVSKAIGTGFANGVRRYDILVDHGSDGPTVRLAGPAARRAAKLGPAGEPLEIVVAVRHDSEWVTAICVITVGAVFPLDLYAQLPDLPPHGPKSSRS